MPGEQDEVFVSARRADALVALCWPSIASDPEPDRATVVVVHARLDGLEHDTGGCEIEGGPVIHPQSVSRLLCNTRVQTVVEDGHGAVLGIGRASRARARLDAPTGEAPRPGVPLPWVRRPPVHRGLPPAWWRHGGTTDLASLALICSFHHRLVHEHGWSVKRGATGGLLWRRPDGTGYESGPSPGCESGRRWVRRSISCRQSETAIDNGRQLRTASQRASTPVRVQPRLEDHRRGGPVDRTAAFPPTGSGFAERPIGLHR